MNKKEATVGAILYCACINNENVYREYKNDNEAIKQFKRLAMIRNGKLTDISRKINNQWSKITWR